MKNPSGSKGVLYVVSTPLGNLEDMTPRGIRILREAELIAAEDTRTTRKLLNHFGIRTPQTSYFEHNEPKKAETLLRRIMEGQKIGTLQDEMRALANMWRAAVTKLDRRFPVESAMRTVVETCADELKSLANGWDRQGS